MIGDKWFTIPEGYRTDFASIPRVVWSLFHPADPRWLVAALVHDWLYGAEWCPRKQADDIFLAAMEKGGTQAVHRATMYSVVRALGQLTYREHTPASIARIRGLSGVTDIKRPLFDNLLKW